MTKPLPFQVDASQFLLADSTVRERMPHLEQLSSLLYIFLFHGAVVALKLRLKEELT
jgi:hypothetical protein